ncbi:MAG: L-arabinokinase [Acidobacteriaceae bacterium]|nr:L-arabinokinase [Acidobacteriaceae bacterium]
MSHFENEVNNQRAEGRFFSQKLPVFIARAPGRLDLMGGNVDYTGGIVFQATIREATWAAVQLRRDNQIVFLNPQMRERGWKEQVEFDYAALRDEAGVRSLVNQSPDVRWTAYVLGIFYFLRNRYPERVKSGANVYIHSEVPLNKGVSSSAAIEVAVMRPASAAYGIDLNGVELAEACQWVENVIAESACGIMDQAASVLGDEGYVLPLLCQPCVPLPLVRLPEALQCWAVDSGVSHAVTGIEYEAARAATFMGFRMICDWENLELALDESGRIPRYVDSKWNGYVSNISPSLFRSRYGHKLPERISGSDFLAKSKTHCDPFTAIRPEVNYRVRDCTRYAIEENQRIQLFIELARSAQGNSIKEVFRLMGDLMYQSHWSYSECGLGNEATDLLVEFVREEGVENGLFGAKVTGGGAGGTVAVLGCKGADKAFRRAVQRYAEARAYEPYVFEGSSMGSDRFGLRKLEAIA